MTTLTQILGRESDRDERSEEVLGRAAKREMSVASLDVAPQRRGAKRRVWKATS